MAFEIEFLAVGEGSRAGDCILIRYGHPQAPRVMVIDGGTQDSGGALVELLQGLTGSAVPVVHDLLVSHPDADHASGALAILEATAVEQVHVQVPWAHAEEVQRLVGDGRRTAQGIADRLREDCPFVADIVAEAQRRRVPIFEPFQGSSVGPFTVLSPPQAAYPRLLLEMLDIEPAAARQASLAEALTKAMGGLMTAAARVAEAWGWETLRDGGVTSARNEMSTVLYGDFGGDGRVLLTADAGLRGLGAAADYAETYGLPLRDFRLVQVPHHGSRRNVGPSILDRLVGPRLPEGTPAQFTAIVSAPKDDEKHPRKVVVNAFRRRGAEVMATQGANILHRSGFPLRPGYGPATPLPFYPTVEDYD
ncbi:ComEC/Rec2 family competence protein [Roseicella aquatilis]|uniref:MBL fold metallo-hydrolase n=1 Tax=Roseicella aquatilis TaxID=2527868 RepID=A0A4R4D3N7_9PROT|nr:MBL fold metallo-hydrolase [Roseicella aquatilis]TCZ54580.1 MBL fold metallo-hydrolase [Roseicella aquatilis]